MTGEAQWTYPQADIAGGTEEMELCTTPPPPEHEESPIIEMPASSNNKTNSNATKSTTSSSTPTPPKVPPPPPPTGKPEDEARPPDDDPPETPPPPPPTISSPSPPPPPRIYAEDLRRDRKRRASPDISDSKIKSKRKDGKEPLPPGVDPPEVAYALSTGLEAASVLYGAQQTNPIYAATLAGAGIPLLSHHPHHAHLMQGQIVHYSPAYHQHLHNQALIARLQGQEAVQFMVADYSRMYEGSQVIAKPPMKVAHESTLGSAINSFYSDIASIERSSAEIEKERADLRLGEPIIAPVAQVPSVDSDSSVTDGQKKKKKMKSGLGKKQKEMSSMVAKWQKAQKNYKEVH